MKDIMVDLETLGTVPGCGVLSIGAVAFDPYSDSEELGDKFYLVVDRRSCAKAGLKEDPDTLAWWHRQSPAAQQVLSDAQDPKVAKQLTVALGDFNKFLPSGARVWGNGADFDNPILACAYAAVGLKQGWAPYNGRCYRTLKGLPGARNVPFERVGTYHNALDDAVSQALHAVRVFKALNLRQDEAPVKVLPSAKAALLKRGRK